MLDFSEFCVFSRIRRAWLKLPHPVPKGLASPDVRKLDQGAVSVTRIAFMFFVRVDGPE